MSRSVQKSDCYKSVGAPELDVSTVRAEMSDFTIERSTSIVETDRRYSSVIRLHGTIDFPSKIKGGLLEVHIVRHGLPSNVDHIDKNHIGVGIFNFFPADTPELHLSTPGGFFDLQVAFAPAEFEEVVNMLLHWGSSPELTITLSADVAGLTPECEWSYNCALTAKNVSISLSNRCARAT